MLQIQLPDGATVVPVIISTDKTQLCILTGGKTAYPVYMTIGTFDKSVRRKPSYHAQTLVGYLPTSTLGDTDLNEAAARMGRSRLFHKAMDIIFGPLKAVAKTGIELTSADGAVRRGHPILASYPADYPEQSLVTCTRYNVTCPKCNIKVDGFGNGKLGTPREQNDSLRKIESAANETSMTKINKKLKRNGLNYIPEPFWADWYLVDIHSAITPDILHQLYQGVVEHLIGWLRNLIGDTELDARFKRLPPAHGVRHFKVGISGLTQVSGPEHKDICKELLGCLLGLSSVPLGAVRASRALLDFLYLAQYPSHSDDTLKYLQDALDEFHVNKEVFLNLDARLGTSWLVHTKETRSFDQFYLTGGHFNFPKLHSLRHYLDSIRLLGTTDNYNTEATERLHIDLAKEAYRATNKKDYYEQMLLWLERREKMWAFEIVLQWRQGTMPQPQSRHLRRHALGPHLAKTPSVSNMQLSILVRNHDANSFIPELHAFISRYRNQFAVTPSRPSANSHRIPITHVDVWHLLKFYVQKTGTPSSSSLDRETSCIAYATPERRSASEKRLPARFDTVLVNEGGTSTHGKGIHGMHTGSRTCIYYRLNVAQVNALDRFVSSSKFPTDSFCQHSDQILNHQVLLLMLSGLLAHVTKCQHTRCIPYHAASDPVVSVMLLLSRLTQYSALANFFLSSVTG